GRAPYRWSCRLPLRCSEEWKLSRVLAGQKVLRDHEASSRGFGRRVPRTARRIGRRRVAHSPACPRYRLMGGLVAPFRARARLRLTRTRTNTKTLTRRSQPEPGAG